MNLYMLGDKAKLLFTVFFSNLAHMTWNKIVIISKVNFNVVIKN